MLSSIVHIVNGDWASLVYDLIEMDVVPPRTNLRRVTMVICFAECVFSLPMGSINFKLYTTLGPLCNFICI